MTFCTKKVYSCKQQKGEVNDAAHGCLFKGLKQPVLQVLSGFNVTASSQ